jgi:purine-binding chemotaxis protein CheW
MEGSMATCIHETKNQERALLVRARSWICALPLPSVVETMRALPVQPIDGAPRFVLGVAIIRGAPLPVIDLAVFIGAGGAGAVGGRFVTMLAGPRRLALSVDEVLGVSSLDAATLERTPPLLDRTLAEHVEKLGALDRHAFALLSAARLLPEDGWPRS